MAMKKRGKAAGVKMIAFEGIDGCGKTTQAEMLFDYLKEKGKDVILTKEPDDSTEFSKTIRKLIFEEDAYKTELVDFFLFLADRAYHCKSVIHGAIEKDQIIICDRFTLSTIAYQHKILSVLNRYNVYTKENVAEHIVRLSAFGIRPRKTIIIDIDVELAMHRIKLRDKDQNNTYDSKKASELSEINRIYRNRQLSTSKRIITINGDDSVENIHKRVIEAIGIFGD